MKIVEISKSKNKHKNKQLIFYHQELSEEEDSQSFDQEKPPIEQSNKV